LYFCMHISEPDWNMFKENNGKSENFNWSHKTILIVEDNLHNYLYLDAILKPTHVNILYAPDGAVAINITREHNDIDLILMDIRLPTVNGFDATRQIREFNPLIPVVALTACSMSNEKEECLSAGCNAYLSKPVSQENLIAVISNFFLLQPSSPKPR